MIHCVQGTRTTHGGGEDTDYWLVPVKIAVLHWTERCAITFSPLPTDASDARASSCLELEVGLRFGSCPLQFVDGSKVVVQ